MNTQNYILFKISAWGLFLIQKPRNGLLTPFSPDFTWNRQIWLFYAEKWIFFKKLGTLLKIFLKFRKFQPRYSYKNILIEKKSILWLCPDNKPKPYHLPYDTHKVLNRFRIITWLWFTSPLKGATHPLMRIHPSKPRKLSNVHYNLHVCKDNLLFKRSFKLTLLMALCLSLLTISSKISPVPLTSLLKNI